MSAAATICFLRIQEKNLHKLYRENSQAEHMKKVSTLCGWKKNIFDLNLDSLTFAKISRVFQEAW